MSDKVIDEFAATKRKGLPEHLADGRKPMTNTTFQQSERTSGKRPEWMERAAQHASGVPAPHMADGSGGHWMEKAFDSNKGGLHRATNTPAGKTIPSYRVKKMAGSGTPHQKQMANAAINANPGKY